MNENVTIIIMIFFFQAEDGIRDHCVTGVQTCALPIWDLLDKGCEARTLISRRGAHANNGCNGIAELRPVYLDMIAADNTRVFHSVNTLCDRRRREANALPKLAVGKSRILLERMQELPASVVKQLFNF